MEEITEWLEESLKLLEAQQTILDSHCQEIQLSLKRLERRSLLQKKIEKDKETLKRESCKVDMKQIDELIEKAQKVLAYDDIALKTTQCSEKVPDAREIERKGKRASTETTSKVVRSSRKPVIEKSRTGQEKGSTRKKHGSRECVTITTSSKNKPAEVVHKKRNDSVKNIEDMNRVSKSGIVSRQQQQQSHEALPYFDPNYVETRRLNCKLMRKLDTLHNDVTLVQERKTAVEEFLQLLGRRGKMTSDQEKFHLVNLLSKNHGAITENTKDLLRQVQTERDKYSVCLDRIEESSKFRLKDDSFSLVQVLKKELVTNEDRMEQDFLKTFRPVAERLINETSLLNLTDSEKMNIYRQVHSLLSPRYESFPVLVLAD